MQEEVEKNFYNERSFIEYFEIIQEVNKLFSEQLESLKNEENIQVIKQLYRTLKSLIDNYISKCEVLEPGELYYIHDKLVF